MLISAALLASISLGAVVELPAGKDNSIFSEGTLKAPISNGAGQHFFAGSSFNGFARRALLEFDLSSIPAGSAIVSARLRLFMSRSLAGPINVAAHRCLQEWGEGASDAPFEEGTGAPAEPGDATWQHAVLPGAEWINAGGDYEPSPSAVTEIGFAGFYEFTGAALAADVQSWLDAPAQNHGWCLIGDESSTQTTKRFDSREHPIAGNRPALIVEFLPPACPGDANGDGMVGLGDIAAVTTNWAQLVPPAPASADLDGSGDIGLGDIAVVVQNWATSCP